MTQRPLLANKSQPETVALGSFKRHKGEASVAGTYLLRKINKKREKLLGLGGGFKGETTELPV